MYKKILFGLLIYSNSLFGNTIFQNSVATADSKSKACNLALLQAQKEALHQSGINIFTSFEKKQTIYENEVKDVINNSLQKSYGYITTISKDEKIQFDQKTGYITCEVYGKFNVDTTKLKSQLLALSQKYENQYQIEKNKTEALKRKNDLIKKYFTLKNNIIKTHTFNYNGKYYCGDTLSLVQCKQQLKNQIKDYYQKELGNRYNIESSLIQIAHTKLSNDIQIITNNGLIIQYDGKAEAKVLSLKNPYIDEIITLNAIIGKNDYIEKPINNTKQKNHLASKEQDDIRFYLGFDYINFDTNSIDPTKINLKPNDNIDTHISINDNIDTHISTIGFNLGFLINNNSILNLSYFSKSYYEGEIFQTTIIALSYNYHFFDIIILKGLYAGIGFAKITNEIIDNQSITSASQSNLGLLLRYGLEYHITNNLLFDLGINSYSSQQKLTYYYKSTYNLIEGSTTIRIVNLNISIKYIF